MKRSSSWNADDEQIEPTRKSADIADDLLSRNFRIRTNSACENDADCVDGLLAIPYM